MQSAPNNIFPLGYRPLSSKAAIYEHLEARLREERPGQQLEIEARLGGYAFARPLAAETLDASFQAPVVFGARPSAAPLRPLLRGLQALQYTFEPSLPAARFYAIADACARHQPTGELEATLDFVLRDGRDTRLSWRLASGEVCETTKSDKESLDLAHQGRQYRLATAFEALRPVPAAQFEALLAQHACAAIRLKRRRVTAFQFMQVCCTHCLSLRRDAVKLKLLELFRRGAHAGAGEAARQLLAENGARESFEVENEVGDPAFLRETLRAAATRANFPAFVDRFLRNTELLEADLGPLGEGERRELRELLGAVPVAGSYLADVLAAPAQG